MNKKEIGQSLIKLELYLLKHFPKKLSKPKSLDMRPINKDLFKIDKKIKIWKQ